MTRAEVIALRKRLGIRQITVARLANVDRSKLSLWECGHVDLAEDELQRVTSVLGKELDQIRNISMPVGVHA